ncbi:MAG: 5-oxoprolinase subunit PxpB [Oscillospiraceae bacterium]|nr:5-oxoprolinase subunit PxpB [Oscillospiraceae bacterium]
MKQTAKISAVGDCAVLVELGSEISPEINARVISLVQLIKEQPIEGAADTIPTFCSLLVNYDPRVISYEKICRRLSDLARLDTRTDEKSAKVFQIPVCYSGDYAPDIEYIAERAGLSVQEVIKIHSGRDYLIYMLGFMPGFPYLGGLDERIHTPRLEVPRVQIRAGSVGIGGTQTGIYPLDSPGGWQLLGMTPLKTYDPTREKPILFEAGDYIRFVPIEKSEFEEIKARVDDGSYEYSF